MRKEYESESENEDLNQNKNKDCIDYKTIVMNGNNVMGKKVVWKPSIIN